MGKSASAPIWRAAGWVQVPSQGMAINPCLTHQFVLAETCTSLSCEDVSGTECPLAQVAVSPGILLQPGSAFSRKMAQKSSAGDLPGSVWLSLSGTFRVGVNLPLHGHFWQCGKCGAAVTTGTPALEMTLHSSILWDAPAAGPMLAWQSQGLGVLTPAPCAALCCLER